MVKVHRRQFTIAPRPCLVDDEWEKHDLPNGYVLSRHRDLPRSEIHVDDRTITVLGYVIPPLEQAESVREFATRATGRFLIIDWPFLIQDACGLLAVYLHQGSDEYICTSSVALAARFTNLESAEGSLRWPEGPTYFPGPSSRLVGLRKLFADQEVNLESGLVGRSDRVFATHGADSASSMVNRSLVHTVSRLAKDHDRLFLALTAGLDSRTLFGALLAASVCFEAVTMAHPGVPRSDIATARQLCRRFGVKHQVIERQQHDPSVLQAWKRHTLESYAGVANYHTVPGSQYRFLGPHDAFIRGGGFELGRRKPAKVGGMNFATADAGSLRQLQGSAAYADRRGVLALDEWLAWRRGHPIGLDFAESYYYDQRIGSWLASVEQGLDAHPGISIQPANSYSVLEWLLSVDDGEKPLGTVQRMALEAVDPGLLKIPINPGPSLAERARRRVVRLIR